jgi:class 3 adenylate cyclase
VDHDDVPRGRTAAPRLQGSRVMAGGADRRLVAIMFTDVVGVSAVTQRDETLAIARRNAALRQAGLE